MSAILVKGGNASFSKNTSANNIVVGLGWKTANDKSAFELQVSIFLLTETGKVCSNNDVIFYGNKKSNNGSIESIANSSTENGDNASFNINLSQLPDDISKLVIVASIHEAKTRQQNFGMVQSAFIQVINADNQQEIVRFKLDDYAGSETAMLFGEVYRYNSEWKFRALGQGFADGLMIIANNYSVTDLNLMLPSHLQDQTMTTDTFSQLSHQAKQIEQNWNTLYQNLVAAQPENPHLGFDHFSQLNDTFQAALQRLHDDLNAPTLILATTGTTSSGKSTIVNLLCGADLMPRMAQEMSAGVVYINHSPEGRRHLRVHSTNGALWECGEWQDLQDDQVREKLTAVMDCFNKNKGINQPEAPRIELTYPLACFSNPELLGLSSLPESTQFKLMDLPGLRNHFDNTNAETIKNCRDALCLVAYNMEETDENRRRELVRQVLEQIKNMGGSPARMLFVLNRIDVFRKDDDWQRRQNEHIGTVQQEIHDILHKELPEHRDVLPHLTYNPLSSLPALFAQRIKADSNRISAADELDAHFNSLIPDELLDDLPRRINNWKDRDFERVSDIVWQNSYGAEFYSCLDRHIQRHFPTLVIPSMVKRFETQVSDAIGELVRACYSQLNGSEEAFKAAQEKLYRQNAELKTFLEQAKQQLLEPTRSLNEALKKRQEIQDNLKKLEAELYEDLNSTSIGTTLETFIEDLLKTEIFQDQLDEDKLLPLADWQYQLRNSATGVLEAMKESLDNKHASFSGTSVESLPKALQDRLTNICAHYASDLQVFHNIHNDSRNDLIQSKLNLFISGLNDILNNCMVLKSQQENKRIHDAMNLLMKVYLQHLQTGIDRMAPEWSLIISESVLSGLIPPAIRPVSLQAELKDNSREERIWWTLWVGTEIIRYKTLPTSKALYESFSKDIGGQVDSLAQAFLDTIGGYIIDLNEKIDSEQERVRYDFDTKLEEAYQQQHNDYEKALQCWQPLHEQSQQVAGQLKQLVKEYLI